MGAPVIVIVESQSGWHLNEDIKMSHPVSFGHLIIINSPFCTYITAKKCQKRFYSKTWGMKRLPKSKRSIAITSITITITRQSQDKTRQSQDIWDGE